MKPIQGKQYTIQDENTLSQVARRAYGDGTLWPKIWSANQTVLRSGDPDVIYPGETILIPILTERELPEIAQTNSDENGIYLDIAGQQLRPLSCRIIRTIDTVADAFTANIAWQPGQEPKLDQIVKPYSYSPVKIYIGSEKVFTGVLYSVSPTISQGSTLNLSGNTATVDLVDSSLKPPFEYNNITIDDLIEKIVDPMGLKTIIKADTGGVFDRVSATNGEKISAFFLKLTRQRGVLLSCDNLGNLVIESPNINGSPVATLEEGVTPGVSGWGVDFNGRDRFNVYRAVGESPFGSQEAIVTDSKVPRSRFKTVKADEATDGNLESAAQWSRNKTLSESLSFQLNVEGWLDQDGDIWAENTKVTIISKSMFLPDGFDFLINRVEYILDGNGRSSVLSFVPPTVYTKGEIIEPW